MINFSNFLGVGHGGEGSFVLEGLSAKILRTFTLAPSLTAAALEERTELGHVNLHWGKAVRHGRQKRRTQALE